MRVSTLAALQPDEVELGVVYASVEGVNESSFEECFAELEKQAHAMGATGLIGMQLVQSQFQWNQRTSLLATAVRSSREPSPPEPAISATAPSEAADPTGASSAAMSDTPAEQ